MRRAAAKEEKLSFLAAALLAAVAALGLPASAGASRFLPQALERTLAAPGLDLGGAIGEVDRHPAFVLLAPSDRDRLALSATSAGAQAFELFPELAPGSPDAEGFKLASGVSAWWVRPNVWEMQWIGSERQWATELYAFVGWQPHMATDPMGDCGVACLQALGWLWGNRQQVTDLAVEAVPQLYGAARATELQVGVGAAKIGVAAVDQGVNTLTLGAPAGAKAATNTLLAGGGLPDALSAGVSAAADKVTYGYATAKDRWQHTKDLLGGAVGAQHYSLGLENVVEGLTGGNVEQVLRGGSELTMGVSQTTLAVAGAGEGVAGVGRLAMKGLAFEDFSLTGLNLGEEIMTDLTPAMPDLAGQGYRSFSAFKRAHGPAGQGSQWHHVVEQTPGNQSRFGPKAIHTTENLLPVEELSHRQISGFYSSIQPQVTGSTAMTVRRWLSSQSFAAQREFGLGLLREFGVLE